MAPIIDGQKAHPSTRGEARSVGKETPKTSSAHDDLIDFGPSEPAATASIPQSSAKFYKPNHVEAVRNYAPPGLQAPLVPEPPLKRIDTEEGSVDEFVDASAS